MTISLLLPNVFFQIDAAFGQPQPARDLVQGQQSAVWGQPAPRRCNRKIVRGAASPAGQSGQPRPCPEPVTALAKTM